MTVATTVKTARTRRPPRRTTASVREGVYSLEDIPNVGPSLAHSLRLAGIRRPAQLPGRDPCQLYDALTKRTGVRHDPCVLDVFMSAVRYMEGAPPRPWWHYTRERKRRYQPAVARH